MTRYAQLVVLLLSFLLPLQVGAEALLAASSCSQMMPGQAKAMAKTSAMSCCGEMVKPNQQKLDAKRSCADKPQSDEQQKPSSCQNIASCTLCKTPAQLNLFSPTLIAAYTSFPHLDIARARQIITLNLASIWRPPCIS